VFIEEIDIFYVFPRDVFIGYGSEIHLVEADKRQRRPKSADFRGAWNLTLQWAAQRETSVRIPHKFGEAAGGVIPSEAFEDDESERERVET
jgi:hypothetical protein